MKNSLLSAIETREAGAAQESELLAAAWRSCRLAVCHPPGGDTRYHPNALTLQRHLSEWTSNLHVRGTEAPLRLPHEEPHSRRSPGPRDCVKTRARSAPIAACQFMPDQRDGRKMHLHMISI